MGNKQSTTTPNADFLSFEEIQERRRLFLKYGIKLFLDAYELSISNYFHPSAKKLEVEENFKTEILEVPPLNLESRSRKWSESEGMEE